MEIDIQRDSQGNAWVGVSKLSKSMAALAPALEQMTLGIINAFRTPFGKPVLTLEEYREILRLSMDESPEKITYVCRTDEALDLTWTAAIYGFKEARVVWLDQEEQFVWIADFFCQDLPRIGPTADEAKRWIRQKANEA